MPFKEGKFESGGNEKILRIGEKEFRVGDLVCYDNGDGVEKDWQLVYFDDKQVRIAKLIGDKQPSPSGKFIGKTKHVDKNVPIDEFIELQTKYSK